MKYMVVYSSRTGNTKKVAEAIVSALPEGTPCVAVAEAPADLSAYDCVFAGFWVDKGTADEEAKKVLEALTAKKVAILQLSEPIRHRSMPINAWLPLRNLCRHIRKSSIPLFVRVPWIRS